MQELPKFYETFLPILEVLKDRKPVHYKDMLRNVFRTYYADLPAAELERTTKNGSLLVLDRIDWGKLYLKQAGMIYQPSRAMVQITDKGMKTLERGQLTLKDIKADADFLAHRKTQVIRPALVKSSEGQTPQDMIDAGIQALEDKTRLELLERLKATDPYDFEKIVNELFEKMGYGGAETTVKTGDGGIDGIIYQDELGLEKIYIQAKRYDGHNVREPEIRNFIGAMSGDTQKGIFVTTSAFDQKAAAKAAAALHKIILIDGVRLSQLMYKHGVGVQMTSNYQVKSVDDDYFA